MKRRRKKKRTLASQMTPCTPECDREKTRLAASSCTGLPARARDYELVHGTTSSCTGLRARGATSASVCPQRSEPARQKDRSKNEKGGAAGRRGGGWRVERKSPMKRYYGKEEKQTSVISGSGRSHGGGQAEERSPASEAALHHSGRY